MVSWRLMNERQDRQCEHYEEQLGDDLVLARRPVHLLLEGRAPPAQRVTILLAALEKYRGQLRAAPY
jgi:hypothetical protein